MHGVSVEDYEREIKAARSAGNLDRVNALQVAKDVIEALEFEHINGSSDVTRACQLGLRRVGILLRQNHPASR